MCQGRIKSKRNSLTYNYYELHHILPNSMFSEYRNLRKNKWNGVLLSAKEHFICHWLLTKMCVHIRDTNKMLHAFNALLNFKSSNQFRLKSNGKSYKEFKESFSKIKSDRWKGPSNPNNFRNISGEHNPMFGSRRIGETNPFFGKTHSKKSMEDGKRTRKERNHHNTTKETIWVNDGIVASRIKVDDFNPEIHKKGMLKYPCPQCNRLIANSRKIRHLASCRVIDA